LPVTVLMTPPATRRTAWLPPSVNTKSLPSVDATETGVLSLAEVAVAPSPS
jgi:hypothetical protein